MNAFLRAKTSLKISEYTASTFYKKEKVYWIGIKK